MTTHELGLLIEAALGRCPDKERIRQHAEGGEWGLVMKCLGAMEKHGKGQVRDARRILASYAVDVRDDVLFNHLVEGSVSIFAGEAWMGVRERLVEAPWRIKRCQVDRLYRGAIFVWDESSLTAMANKDYFISEREEQKIVRDWMKHVAWQNPSDRIARLQRFQQVWAALRMRACLAQSKPEAPRLALVNGL